MSVATQAGRLPPGLAVDGAVRVYRLRGTMQRAGALFSDPERTHAPPVPDPELVLGLRRVIAEEKPDVVHAHNWLLHSFVPLKPFNRVPLVVTLHDYSLVCAKKNFMHKGHPCSGPGLAKCLDCAGQHYGRIKGGVTTLSNWVDSGLERRVVDKFLAVSGAVARFNNLRDTGVPFEVVPNFVPDDIGAPQPDPGSTINQLPAEYILYVGDLSVQKGILLLLEAHARLPSAFPLVLIGRRFPETPAELPDNVHVFTSWPHAAVMHAWSRCLFGVAPSIWHEPCATVVMEAMGQGKPMIVTDMGGMPDLVDNDRSGLVVPPEPAALTAALTRLLSNPALREHMAEASRVRVEMFKASAVVPRIEAIYREVIASRDVSASAA